MVDLAIRSLKSLKEGVRSVSSENTLDEFKLQMPLDALTMISVSGYIFWYGTLTIDLIPLSPRHNVA